MTSQFVDLYNYVPLDMKRCIRHFTKWHIHPFISKESLFGIPFYCEGPRCTNVCDFIKKRPRKTTSFCYLFVLYFYLKYYLLKGIDATE